MDEDAIRRNREEEAKFKELQKEKDSAKKEWRLKCWRQWTTTERVRHITPSMEMRTIYREFILYLIFLVLVCLSAYGMLGWERYRFSKVITDLFINTPSTDKSGQKGKTFAQLKTMDDWWEFAETTMIDNFLWDFWYKTTDKHKFIGMDDRNMLYENKVLGSPRLRQVRVRPDSCTIYEKFRRKFAACYASLTSSNEDTGSYGLGVGTAWSYHTQAQLKGFTYYGRIATYPGGGFYQDLSTSDRNKMTSTIAMLKDNSWIDRGTRAVFLDFALYNANSNLFCVATLLMEYPPTGGLIPSWDIKTIKLLHYLNQYDYFVLGCQIMVVVFSVYHLIEEIREILYFRAHYFLHFWNLYDMFLVLVNFACIGINIVRSIVIQNRIGKLVNLGDEFGNFQDLAYWETQSSNIVAITVFFVWIKILKFLKFNKTMCQLTLTLSRCSKDVLGFLVMFLIFFLAFAQCGFLMFGYQVDGYKSVLSACFTLFLTMLGNFDFDSLEKADHLLGPVFFISYIFVVVIILLNVFLAIIADSYAEVKAITEDIEFYDMGVFLCQGLRRFLIKVRCVKEQGDEEDDKLNWRKIRQMLLDHEFTEIEIDTFQRRYGIEDEDEILREEDAARMLEDMRGHDVGGPSSMSVGEIGPAYRNLQADIIELTNRVDYIEESLIDLLPRVEELIRAIDRIAP